MTSLSQSSAYLELLYCRAYPYFKQLTYPKTLDKSSRDLNANLNIYSIDLIESRAFSMSKESPVFVLAP